MFYIKEVIQKRWQVTPKFKSCPCSVISFQHIGNRLAVDKDGIAKTGKNVLVEKVNQQRVMTAKNPFFKVIGAIAGSDKVNINGRNVMMKDTFVDLPGHIKVGSRPIEVFVFFLEDVEIQ